jgi:type 1 fimbria pilin
MMTDILLNSNSSRCSLSETNEVYMPRALLKLLITCFVACIGTNCLACTGTTIALNVNLGTMSDDSIGKVAVGGVIKTLEAKWNSFGSTNASGNCGATTLINYEVPGAQAAGYTNVYDTNLQGIGIRLSVWTLNAVAAGPSGGYYGTPTTPTAMPTQLPLQDISVGSYGTGYNQLRVELVRTASNWQGGSLSVTGPVLVISDQSGKTGPITLNTIMVSGTLSLAGCSVTTKSLVVNLGAVRMPDVAFSNPAAGKDFTIEMTCSSNPSLAIQFDGSAVVGNPTVLQLRNEPGVATGIGLQITNSKGDPVTIGEPMPLIDAAPTGVNQYHFTARYIPTASHRTPGNADANATFTMQYN